jgi:hypothetical protein
MAISTVKISDTIEWSKRFSFDRNPVIGNSLEPALSSAAMVMQTILGPPFSWWWNNEEVVFTCNPTEKTATSTVVSLSGKTLTVTATNTFAAGQALLPSALASMTWLNGQIIVVDTATSSGFTATLNLVGTPTSDTAGTFTALSTQDYATASPEFSHIEHASVLDINQTPPKWYALEVKNNLELDTTQDRPRFVNPHVEDSNGNMTWRVMPAPDLAYPVSIHIQKAAPSLATLGVNSTWAPIPDFMQYIYNWGFLALIWAFSDDPRFQIANQKFIAGILARAEGISDEDRNTFLNAWNGLTGHQQAETNQGIQARGV